MNINHFIATDNNDFERDKKQLDEAAVVARYLDSLYEKKISESTPNNAEDNDNGSVSAVTFSVDAFPRHRNIIKHQKSIASVSVITEGTINQTRKWDREGDESVESNQDDLPYGGRTVLAKERSL